MKGVHSWLARWACRAGTRNFCSALAAWPSKQYFFLAVHYFNSFVPIAQQVGQAAVLGHLSPMTNPTPLGISEPNTFTLG